MMKQIFLIIVFLCPALLQVSAQTASTGSVLPLKEIRVAQDGSGNFTTIQAAVNSVRDLGQWRVKIRIKKGVYHEKLVIPSWKTKISLIGEDKEQTVITNNDFSGKAYPGGRDAFGNDKFSTYTSYTVLVQGDDFTAENLTIENTAGRVGQAVAFHVEGDRCAIINCRLSGNQDTLYAATEGSRQYYKDCDIEGTTDFIFGEATVVFDNCKIKSLANSYITAAATAVRQPFGFVLINCKLIAADGVDKVFLGRPWRPYAKTVFLNSVFGKHIVPGGWNPWKGDAMFKDKELTAYYAEYGNTGAGALTTSRVPWSKSLSKKEAKKYTLKNILGGKDNWQPLIYTF
jgi:pectinesterase